MIAVGRRTAIRALTKFHVGDRVYAPDIGYGTVINIISADVDYPVEVVWGDKDNEVEDYFTEDGHFWKNAEVDDGDFVIHVVKEGEEEKASDKQDAVNPSHYRVSGIPEAIEIIQHLMTKEQFEGFLWGNIIKYAYRYGRKGDEAETAGKIGWYAQKLKELKECE